MCVCMCVSQLCLTLWPQRLLPTSHLCPWNFPGKNTGVGSHSLLQGIFQVQRSNQVSCIAGRFFTAWATREAHSQKHMLNQSSTAFLKLVSNIVCGSQTGPKKKKCPWLMIQKILTGPIILWGLERSMCYQTLSFFESIFKHFSRANEERITNKDVEVNNSHRAMHEQGEGLFGRHCSQGRYELEEGFKSGIEGVRSLGREDPLKEEMATHSRNLVWRIPWMEEPAGLQCMGRKESNTTKRLTLPLSHTFHNIAYKFFLIGRIKFE